MQANPRPASRNFRAITGNCSDPGVNQLDTRRFAGIFPLEIPEANFVDATQEDHYDDFDNPSRSQLVAKHDNNISISHVRVASVASMDNRPLSEAEQIISCSGAVHRNDHVTEHGLTEINEGVIQIPDDQRSMYTIATSVDPQSAMDMMWRPNPKIQMCLTDQIALIQAQSQAIAIMHDAGLKPTNKIQCRRWGCADILPGVEALKYHLHIHNIADTAAKCNGAPPSAGESSKIHSICGPKTSKRSHSRSKSSLGIQHKHSMTYFHSRNVSVGTLIPSHLSPRDRFPEAQHVPSFTTVAKSLVSDHTSSNSAIPIPLFNNNETTCTASSTLSRGRRARKESVVSSVAAGNPASAMFLSPTSSPDMHGRFLFTPHTNAPVPPALNSAMNDENDNCAITSSESTHQDLEKLNGSRSSMRTLSSTRALSPIQNGIRRVLSIGCAVDPSE